MNTSPSVTVIENGSQTYLKAAAFLLPAASLWAFAHLFLLPKLELLWARAGGMLPEAQWVMDASTIIMRSGGFALVAVAAVLLLLELRFRLYRRVAVGVIAWVLNSAVLIALTAMCILLTILATPSFR